MNKNEKPADDSRLGSSHGSPVTVRVVRRGFHYEITSDGVCPEIDRHHVASFGGGILKNIQDQILESVAKLNRDRLAIGKSPVVFEDFWKGRNRASGRPY